MYGKKRPKGQKAATTTSTDLPEPRPVPSPNSFSFPPFRLPGRIPLDPRPIAYSSLSTFFAPPFVLFVYLLSPFSQVALIRDENGFGIHDLSKMFGSRIFGQGHGEGR